MVHRIINLPVNLSFFLFGPRQTGKTSLIQEFMDKKTWKVDLLLNEIFFKYSKNPELFRKESEEKIKTGFKKIFVDEVQQVPRILNEIQALMSAHPEVQFILTGSSARKLKRGAANLLGGRAVERHLFPFIYSEIKESFDLDEVLQYGSLPPVYGKTSEQQADILNAYVNVYLREEIQSEGLVRNLGGFSRFLEISAAQFGELVNFTSIARDCHLTARSVQSYYEILEDTLVGFRLEPWAKSARKRMIGHPKFYFFDNGVTNAINKNLKGEINPLLKGRLFEQFIVLETMRLIHYKRSEANIYFWRTNHGAEIDLLIEKHGQLKAACEIKSSSNISGAHLSGIRAFRQENQKVPCFVICRADNAYELDSVKVLPWQSYLEKINDLV